MKETTLLSGRMVVNTRKVRFFLSKPPATAPSSGSSVPLSDRLRLAARLHLHWNAPGEHPARPAVRRSAVRKGHRGLRPAEGHRTTSQGRAHQVSPRSSPSRKLVSDLVSAHPCRLGEKGLTLSGGQQQRVVSSLPLVQPKGQEADQRLWLLSPGPRASRL